MGADQAGFVLTPGATRLGQVARMAGVAGLVSPLRTSVRGFRSSARRYADAAPTGIPYSKLNLGVPAETWTNEKRVACTPANTALFTKKGFTVNVQEGAGRLSNFRDEDYAAAGANIVSKEAAFAQDITLKLWRPRRLQLLVWTACQESQGHRSLMRSPPWATSLGTELWSRPAITLAGSSLVKSLLQGKCPQPRCLSLVVE